MVVLSAALLTKNKTLLARQFVEISRLRIEGLLSAFLRLIESGTKDRTYIETDTVRYVYLPVDGIYLVIITNKQSNILEDIETLKLMQQVIQSCFDSSINEDNILTNAFDIVFALDEVISFGYRESVTLTQIKAYTEMESHEEKLSLLVKQDKIKEERKKSQLAASRLDKERKERIKKEQTLQIEQNKLLSALAPVDTILLDSTPTIQDHTNISTTTGPVDTNFDIKLGKGMDLGKKKNPNDLLNALRSN